MIRFSAALPCSFRLLSRPFTLIPALLFGASSLDMLHAATVLVQTTTVVSSSANPIAPGHSVTFTATVTHSGSPVNSGIVSFNIAGCGSVPVSSGQAHCTTSFAAYGPNTVTATYSAPSTYAGSSGSVTENVGTSQTITFTQPASPAAPGSTATLSATASSGLPVTFSVTSGDATISGNTITYGSPGSVTIAANQAGANPYAPAATVSKDVTVYTPTLETLSVTGVPSTAHNSVPQTATVTAYDQYGNIFTTYTGSVSFTSTDPRATLPAASSFTSTDHGVHTASVTFGTAGSQSLTATSASVSGTESNIQVDDVIVTLNSDGAVTTISEIGTTVVPSTSATGTATGLAIDASGNSWSAISSTNSVTAISSNGQLLGSYTGAGISNPSALTIDGNGIVWITNGNGTVSALTSTGTPAVSNGTPLLKSNTLVSPSSIIVDLSGSLWIASQGSSTVTKILGVAAPVTTPTAAAVTKDALGTEP